MLFIRSLDSARLTSAAYVEGPAAPAVWYDLVDPTPDELRAVEQAAEFDIPTRAEMEEIEVSSRLYNEDGVEYMTVTAVARLDTDLPIKSPVLFVLGPKALATVRFTELKPFGNVVDRLSRSNGAAGNATPEQIMLLLIEAMVDRLADALEWIGAEIDGVSRGVFRPTEKLNASKRDAVLQQTIEQVGREGDLLGMVRESLVGFTRLASYHHGVARIDRRAADSEARVQTIQRDVAALLDHASYLGTKVNFLLDATLGLINLEQNQIIKIFSIAAVCLMPPTLVASVYGMNFKSIPELDFPYGYPMALCMMIVTAIAPYLYFKRKGWL
ncbi:MAG: magnesium transporter CorA family protein [Hyphomicrobiales bacterium]|nr:magnesium transporter CorA family protein [Hyphomicrobiales bacterium]